MTLLIVDDEMLAIQGLMACLPWERLSYDKVLSASNYAQAVNLFMSNKIDVLLCDIEMPKESGLELVKWVREHFRATECIFLTCHDDFMFAKQAVDFQCLGYILKPADTEEVVNYLAKAAEKVRQTGKNELYREFGETYVSKLAETAGEKDVMAAAEAYIHENIAGDLKLEQLAGIAHVSLNHLGRLFKKKYNLTPIDYITRERMLLARELLGYNNLSISMVASRAGYNSYSYFTKTFGQHFGMTPTEYRKLQTGK